MVYFGPEGTFTEEAVRGEPDLASGVLEARPSIEDVLSEVSGGGASLGVVPLENAIEGTVNATMDALLFDHDLLIQREMVLDIHLHLMGVPGTTIGEVRRVSSFPVALAQCRKFLAACLPEAEVVAAASTADAARELAASRARGSAAVAPRLAARLYGLEILAAEVEDHPENQTRFVAVSTPEAGIPPPTGHDRTTIVCFQHRDEPGSLHGILGQFAARNINLTKLESRPTKQGLGEYCFVIDLEGHLADEVVKDCLRDVQAGLAQVKFLGSYPAAGADGAERRRDAADAWKRADAWLESLTARIRTA